MILQFALTVGRVVIWLGSRKGGRNIAMSEAEKVFWPGQVPELVFDARQLDALASGSRAEVFWVYEAANPLSVNEVAAILGRTPQSVRYHTNVLLEADLILVAETRKRHARIQEAYVKKAVLSYNPLPPVSAEVLHAKRKQFQAMWRQFDRDRAAVNLVENADPSHGWLSYIRRNTARLTPESIKAFQEAAIQLIDDFVDRNDPEGIRTTLVTFICPQFGESARIYEGLTGNKLPSDLSDDES